MKDTNYHIIDRNGRLVTEEGESETEAHNTMRHFRDNVNRDLLPLQVVHRSKLSAKAQAVLTDYENKLAEAMGQVKGRAA